jgi:hypothetical protein
MQAHIAHLNNLNIRATQSGLLVACPVVDAVAAVVNAATIANAEDCNDQITSRPQSKPTKRQAPNPLQQWQSRMRPFAVLEADVREEIRCPTRANKQK